MAKQDLRRAGRYKWRIQFLEPQTTVNEVNEEFTGEPVVKYDNFPACKVETQKTEEQDVSNNASSSSLKQDWEIRFFTDLDIKTTWLIKDLFENRIYKIISPVQEVGFRQGLLIKTEFVE